MEQATQATTPTASTQDRQPPAPGSFEQAAEVAAGIVGPLASQPFSARIERDYPSGWRVVLTFRDDTAHGVYILGTLLDVPVTRATVESGVHLEVCTRIQGVEVCAAALVTPAQAARIEGESAPSEDQLPVTPVPLAESPDAEDSTPAQPTDAQDLGVEDDVARCVRCGCTEDAACEGGCFWIPNRLLVDVCSACATPEEFAAVNSTAEISDGAA